MKVKSHLTHVHLDEMMPVTNQINNNDDTLAKVVISVSNSYIQDYQMLQFLINLITMYSF